MDEREQKEILYRLDERTDHIQQNVEELRIELNKQNAVVNENSKRSRKNETKINVASYLGGAVLTGIIAALTGIIPL